MKHGNLYWATSLVWMAGLQQIQAAGDSKQPNIVFILADDLGWTDLGVMGSDYYETPNIDRLASQGLLFDNAYATAANSAPSRACMMTGMYTPRHGVFTVSPPDRGDRTKRKLIPCPNTDDVRADFVTLAEALQQQGYQCGHIGKWHLGDDADGTGPLSQGFIWNVGGNRAGFPYSSMHSGDWKLICNYEDQSLELYNLKEDQGETKNLADSCPEKREELYCRLKQWIEQTHAPIPTEPNPYFISSGIKEY